MDGSIKRRLATLQNRPLPVSPVITNTYNYDTLRRKDNSKGTCGRRTENLYDSSTFVQAENQTYGRYSDHNENHFLHIDSLQIAETNNGPLVRRSKVCGTGDKFKLLPVEDLVKRLNTQESACTDENVISDLEYYITFTLMPILKGENNLRKLLILMTANKQSVKHVSAQAIQNIILQMPLTRISDQDCIDIFMFGLKILIDEFCKVKNNVNSAILVKALLLEFLACLFIWMLHSNSYESNVSALQNIFMEKETQMTYQQSAQTLPKILVESFLLSGRTLSVATVVKSSLRIPEWDSAVREKSTQNSIVGQFGDLSFIEQMACVLLLVNTSIRRKDFDKTFKLLNDCITSLKTDGRSSDDRSLLFFVDWIVTFALKWYGSVESSNINFKKKQEIEVELLGILEKVTVDDVMNGKESFLFHENKEIRIWALKQFVQGKNNNQNSLVQVCHQHLERSLIRLNLEIEPNDYTTSDLASQPQWMETKCRLFGTFCKLKLLLPSTECLQGNACDNYKSRADPQKTKYYMNELDILTKLEEGEGHKNVVELLVHQCIPFPLYFILCDNDSENLQSYLLRKRQEKTPIPLNTLLEIILQALKAVDFLHGKGIVHRNVMAAAFGIRFGRNDDMIQLCDFKLAKILWNKWEQPRKEYTDLLCDDIPTRWSAPESLMHGKFSRMSDSWMLFMTAGEVLEHGRWPLTDHQHSSIEAVIENMLFNDCRVHDNPCIPQQIYKMILDGTEYNEQKRLELPKFEELLIDFISKLPHQTANDVYQSAAQTWKLESTMPNLSKAQIDCNSVPEKGIPESAKKYRKTDKDPEEVYYEENYISRAEKRTVCRVVTECDITWLDEPQIEYEGQNIVIEETVFHCFVQNVLPNLVNLRHDDLGINPWPPRPIATEHTRDEEFKLRYNIPDSNSLLEMCIHQQFGHTINEYMEIIYKLALLVDAFHDAGWILNCLRAKNIRVTVDGQVIITRIGRMVYNNDRCFHKDHVIHDVPSDMKRWLPFEAIENRIISQHSDVYSFGMLISELCAILSIKGPRYEDDIYEGYICDYPRDFCKERELNCVPFGHVHCDQLGRHLKGGHIPNRQPACPKEVYDISKKCWEFQRCDRPTMKDLIIDLQPFVKNHKDIQKPTLILNTTQPYRYRELNVSAQRQNATSDCAHRVPEKSPQQQHQQQQRQLASNHPSGTTDIEPYGSYSTAKSASISEPKGKNPMASKRTHGAYDSSTTSSSSGRIRPKKKPHKSVIEFNNST